jgi:hypothetical protein
MRLRTERVTWREVDDEIVALDLESSTYFAANDTGSVLMKLLADGVASKSQLAEALVARFEVDPETARADSERFLTSLTTQGLLDMEGT